MEIIIYILAGTAVGLVLGYVLFVALRKSALEKERATIIEEAKSQGESIKKDRILEAKEKFMQMRSDHDRDVNKRNQELGNSENRLRQKEQTLDQKLKDIQKKEEDTQRSKQNFDAQAQTLSNKQKEVDKLREQQVLQLLKPRSKCWKPCVKPRTPKACNWLKT